MNMDLLKLPIGEQSFEKLRTENRLYVDKTEYIYRMAQDGTHYFLSRPRRFGKSLLLSTIEAYFLGKRELFNGLYIGQVEKEWPIHPVFHLDYNAQTYDSEQKLYNVINDYLAQQETIYGTEPSEVDLSLRFMGIIRRAYEKTGKRVVILVDEYDKPLLQAIDNPVLQDRYRNILRGFYAVLKTMDQYIQFSLLTGITKFSKISIFSDLNNLRDISRNRYYASICGITDEEIDRDLYPYILRFSEETNKSYEEIRKQLQTMYDGYHFVDQTPGLYNPFSLMNAIWWKEIGSYWFETGTPTVLVEMLQRNHYSLPDLEEPVDTSALDSKDGNNDSIVPLLYQSGYLSILRSDEAGLVSWLTFPNEEVRSGFFKFLLPYYTSIQRTRTNAILLGFIDDVRKGNVAQFLTRLQSFFADFQYDAQTTPEAHFRNVLYILCKLIGLQVDAEYMTSDGRIDLLMRTDKYVYIIECKIDSTAQVALQQIKDKEYMLPWTLDNRQKILIGLNFSTTTRRPNGWIIEYEDGTTVEKTVEKTSDKILALIKTNPQITMKEIAQTLSMSERGVEEQIKGMRDKSLKRVGGRKKGHWEIISTDR